jgi:hypothetical protein
MNESRYPLSWPTDWKRTTNRTRGNFGRVDYGGDGSYAGKSRVSIDMAFERIERELERFGIELSTVVVSTNLKLNIRGIPAGNQGEPSDPGAAVYWQRKGKSQCMAIDSYSRVADNLAAIAASLSAMRAIERHGGAQILDRAFLGFAQLPAAVGRPWREVLQLVTCKYITREVIQDRFKELARSQHSDVAGGSHDAMVELNAAREQALQEVK